MEKRKSNAGRKTKYLTKYSKDIFVLKKDLYTDKAICKSWGITHDTFYVWKKKYPEFSDNYKRGVKESYSDLKELAKSALCRMVTGYEVVELQEQGFIDLTKRKKKKGDLEDPQKVVTEFKRVKKWVQPNIVAVLATLYNMDKENFVRNPEPATGMDSQIIETKYTVIGEDE
jgi:hypothetical protein